MPADSMFRLVMRNEGAHGASDMMVCKTTLWHRLKVGVTHDEQATQDRAFMYQHFVKGFSIRADLRDGSLQTRSLKCTIRHSQSSISHTSTSHLKPLDTRRLSMHRFQNAFSSKLSYSLAFPKPGPEPCPRYPFRILFLLPDNRNSQLSTLHHHHPILPIPWSHTLQPTPYPITIHTSYTIPLARFPSPPL